MNILINLDTIEYTAKPQGEEIGAITNRIAYNKQSIELKEFAVQLSEQGKTVMLATYQTKPSVNNEIEQQQVLMLDFDNKDTNNQFTFKNALANEFIKKHASFLYRTFSDKKSETDKFRVVFVLDKAVVDNDTIKCAYQSLLSLFPQADKSTTNPNRLFFGSNDSYTEINFENRLSIVSLLNETTFSEQKRKPGHVDNSYKGVVNSTPNVINNQLVYELLRNGEYKQVKDIIHKKYKGTNKINNTFKSESDAYKFFKTQFDLVEFLDLPNTKSFLCIFENEQNASASIYLSEANVQLYNNFATNRKADLVGLVARLTGKLTFESIELLIDLTDSTLIAGTKIQKQVNAAETFIRDLSDSTFKEKYPKIHKYLGKDIMEITDILQIVSDYKHFDTNDNIQILVYLAMDSIRKKLTNHLGYRVTMNKVNKCISLLAFSDIVIKQSIETLDKSVIDSIDLNRMEHGMEYQRYPNFLTLSTNIDLNAIENAFVELESKKFTINGGLNYEWFYTNYSVDIAQKVFPQKFSASQQSNITDLLVVNQESTKKLEKIMRIIHDYFTENNTNYIYNSTLKKLLKEQGFPKVEKNLGKYRNKVAQDYELYFTDTLKFSRISKELSQQLNIPHSERIKNGNIFYKET